MRFSRRGSALLLILFWLSLLATGLAVVYARHEARRLFVELEQLNAQRDRLDIEWGRLRIEQSTWATHARVEKLARVELHMTVPVPEEVRLVYP